ncbi:MAG TPA: cobaltochelatase subunit CobN, partial [Caldilineaceae bacterium]|nr:cobaltochelatase subunit CobN [Caldilineaceae bacterium]
TGWGFDPPHELPLHGVYEARDWRLETCPQPPVSKLQSPVSSLQSQLPTVGILFYRAHLLSGNTEFVDAICAELARRGLAARPVYTQSLRECDQEGVPLALKLLHETGPACGERAEPVDAIISTLSFALGDPNRVLERFDAPMVQAITSSSDRAAWQRNGRGLNPLDTAMNVAIPEFDGRIISVPIAFKEATADGGARYAPDRERIARMVGLVERLVTLRRKPNAKKRIAFVLTNSAAKAARIGNAVGLDAPASLLKLLHRMQAAGYRVEGL